MFRTGCPTPGGKRTSWLFSANSIKPLSDRAGELMWFSMWVIMYFSSRSWFLPPRKMCDNDRLTMLPPSTGLLVWASYMAFVQSHTSAN
eukprot:6249943-Pyramimonas_sp.AAC.1